MDARKPGGQPGITDIHVYPCCPQRPMSSSCRLGSATAGYPLPFRSRRRSSVGKIPDVVTDSSVLLRALEYLGPTSSALCLADSGRIRLPCLQAGALADGGYFPAACNSRMFALSRLRWPRPSVHRRLRFARSRAEQPVSVTILTSASRSRRVFTSSGEQKQAASISGVYPASGLLASMSKPALHRAITAPGCSTKVAE